ncbi:hypothetical protein KSE_76550t [Kitasatospora setae KM-6054]|uniref:Uncharacterized protein n=1 Tax=Kitasatospora setae (strain ATCC 33774 / DSM 43861 / JCM 3304 / KCC A-0304 / NBRC 14216 / KM-6054) TaxID=452652 RepID=E4MYX9_KITSK|nr:hypothetical protein KSE_00190t [Kitasatospora setae KM-6054]BAJ33406.1 hypothetical protein KSE_76550t [Kitasatospora setae KM-6054]
MPTWRSLGLICGNANQPQITVGLGEEPVPEGSAGARDGPGRPGVRPRPRFRVGMRLRVGVRGALDRQEAGAAGGGLAAVVVGRGAGKVEWSTVGHGPSLPRRWAPGPERRPEDGRAAAGPGE